MRAILFITTLVLLTLPACKTKIARETNLYANPLDKFLYNVAGLKKGDTIERVYELYGEPTKHTINDEKYTFNTVYYNIIDEKLNDKRAFSFSYYKDTHKIYVIGIYPAAAHLFKEKGIEETLYTDLHADELRKIFGYQELGHVGDLRYNQDEFAVEFYCYKFYEYKCFNYDIYWWRKQ